MICSINVSIFNESFDNYEGDHKKMSSNNIYVTFNF